MPYGYILILAVVGLTLHFVLATGASRTAKTLTLGVLGGCLLCRFWLHSYSNTAVFVMVGLGIFIYFYRVRLQVYSRSGDFSMFVVSQVERQGGHTVTKAPLPVVPARWTIKSDTGGFQATIIGAAFANLEGVMQQAFGVPKTSVAANVGGRPYRVWAATEIGVTIQLIGSPDGAEIICVRGMRDVAERHQRTETTD